MFLLMGGTWIIRLWGLQPVSPNQKKENVQPDTWDADWNPLSKHGGGIYLPLSIILYPDPLCLPAPGVHKTPRNGSSRHSPRLDQDYLFLDWKKEKKSEMKNTQIKKKKETL